MQAYNHLAATFARAEKIHPDLMEPYSARLAEGATVEERAEIMRAGLRETFRRRYPMPDAFWPKAGALA